MSRTSWSIFAKVAFSAAAVLLTAYAIHRACRSDLFTLQVVEIEPMPEGSPVSVERISELSAVTAGNGNLFALELKPIEKRLLTEPWIDSVSLVKRFPQTLSIQVKLRQPVALLQAESGRIHYVDANGVVFGSLALAHSADLPVLTGFKRDEPAKIRSALAFLEIWQKSPCAELARLSSITWESQRGYRAWISYPMAQSGWGRSLVTLGHTLGEDPAADVLAQLDRVSKVLRYLSIKNLQARRIWADTGKKIVVRIAHRS